MAQEIPKIEEGEMKDVNDDQQSKWVHNSSVDYKGNIPARASTGAWRASIFIITIDFSERVAYFGIAMNLVTYLNKVLHQDLKTSAKNVNYWTGLSTVLSLFGAFLADAYFGRFFMIMLSSLIYLLGLSLIAMSEFIPILRPCNNINITVEKGNNCSHGASNKVHEAVFFLALYLLSLGAGGHKPNLQSFGADQFDDDHLEERLQKMSFFNWWNFALCFGILLGTTLIVYVEDHLGWGIANSILTLTMGVSVLMFYLAKSFYRYRTPQGSPLMPIFHVLVAALSKRNLPHPSNPEMLYEIPKSQNIRGRLLCHTNSLRFLDKAAIVEANDVIQHLDGKPIIINTKTKRLATVTMVEETKFIINMIPIWLTSMIFGICLAQASTFFVKQGSTMDRKIGSRFEIPPASVGTLGGIAMLLAIAAYEKIIVPVLRRSGGHERGLRILQRIGVGMIFPGLAMAVAALVERKRLRMAAEQGLLQGAAGQPPPPLPMSVFWVAPQFIILGIGDSFAFVGLQEFFYEQVPDSMRSLGIAIFLSAFGVGNFISGFLISIAAHITEKFGSGWFGKDLNSSRLDKFFWLMTIICNLNLCTYVFFAKRHVYKSVKNATVAADSLEEGDTTQPLPPPP